MTLTSSTLQIRRHKNSEDLNIVTFAGTDILPFYVINMDIVSSFTDSYFSFLATLNLFCIVVFYQFE